MVRAREGPLNLIRKDLRSLLVFCWTVPVPLHSCYIDRALAHAGHRCTQTQGMPPPPPPPTWEGYYSIQAPPIRSRDEASVEVAHQEEETTAILDGCGRLV
jgi:hypothetical protein